MHNPSQFREGETVDVVAAVHEEDGWHEFWVDSAQELVGKRVKVLRAHSVRGYFCEKRRVARAWLPSTALKSIRGSRTLIEVPTNES